MAVKKFEPIGINVITRTVDATGAQVITRALFMNTVAQVLDVVNTLEIKDGHRLYTDRTDFQVSFTPNTFTIANNVEDYEVIWRGNTWRIIDVQEDNRREYVKLVCYRAEPTIQP